MRIQISSKKSDDPPQEEREVHEFAHENLHQAHSKQKEEFDKGPKGLIFNYDPT